MVRRKNEQKKFDFTCGFKDTIATADNLFNISLSVYFLLRHLMKGLERIS